MAPETYKIYLAVHKESGKVYVGLTSRTAKERWYKHRRLAFVENKDTHFYRALRKYGESAFELHTVSEATSPGDVQNLERVWITLLRANVSEFGYNTAAGGDHPRHTEETKKKIGDVQRGKRRKPHPLKGTPELKERMDAMREKAKAASWKTCGDLHWSRRIGFSEKTRQKISDSLRRSYAEGRRQRSPVTAE